MHTKHILLLIMLLTGCILVSCTTVQFLRDDEKLYTGATIALQSPDRITDKSTILKTAELALKPKPNNRFLGLRMKLWFYDIAGGDSATKGLGKWIKNTLGEPPVLISSVRPALTAKYIDANFFNIGIFNSAISYDIKESDKTASITYLCSIKKPYTLKNIIYPAAVDTMNRLLFSLKKESLLKPGATYNLDILKKERVRIDSVLKDHGYFYFNPDYLEFKADTSSHDKTINLALSIKDETPDKALIQYRINHVSVDPDYSLQTDSVGVNQDTTIIDSVTFIRRSTIHPKIILRSIFIKKNDLYSRMQHNITLHRLMSMGNFKYVNINFTESDTGNQSGLDALILLTPLPKRTVASELTLVSKSNDFVGPDLTLTYSNRNALNGAELLNVKLAGSFETQFTGKYNNLYSYEFNPLVELYIPRFTVPFSINNPFSEFVPKTKISLGYNYSKKIGYFNLASLQFLYGFKWKNNVRTEQELDPVNIIYTSISNKSDQFNALLDSIPFLEKSYEDQFIAGGFYSFTYNELTIPNIKQQLYLNTTAEVAGNTFSLVKYLATGKAPSAQNPQSIAGEIYSQYARTTIDVRNYFNFSNQSKLALRLYTGIGKAYGNSSTLPYIKQFFSGGPNSIRAFQINTLGPGTSQQNMQKALAFAEFGGDIKLEGNAEYRCDLFSIFKGALFLDAGNDWLFSSNPDINAQPFAFSRFYKELAVGTGAGLRLDATIFVLRFDLGIPLRKPWLEPDKRWVINQIDFGSSQWRSDNLVLNIAIGYPF